MTDHKVKYHNGAKFYYGDHPVGTHILTLKRKDEIIEIKHQALNRDIFAQGALEVVKSYI